MHGHRKTIEVKIFVSYAGITRIRFMGFGNSLLSVSAENNSAPLFTCSTIVCYRTEFVKSVYRQIPRKTAALADKS